MCPIETATVMVMDISRYVREVFMEKQQQGDGARVCGVQYRTVHAKRGVHSMVLARRLTGRGFIVRLLLRNLAWTAHAGTGAHHTQPVLSLCCSADLHKCRVRGLRPRLCCRSWSSRVGVEALRPSHGCRSLEERLIIILNFPIYG